MAQPPEQPPGSRPSVLHVLDTEEYAGRESVVEMLAEAQLEAGHDVRVAAVVESGEPGSPFLDVMEERGIPLHVVSLPPRAYLRERSNLARICRSAGVDVLHTHGYRPDVVGRSAAAKAGVATVSTVHGFTGGSWKNRCYEHLQRLSLRWFDAVVAVSDGVARTLVEHGVPRAKVRVIRNAWGGREDFFTKSDARERLQVDEDRFLIGWVGRVSREKGLDVLIGAFRQIDLAGARLSIIGDGPERRHLERETRNLEGAEGIRWHGKISGAYRLFPAFDVFVLSSRTEGTPVVLLEAMAAGVPIVATSVGGVVDMLTQREAWLVPPEAPDAMATTVGEVRRNPNEARARAAAARRRVETEFGPAEWASRYGRIYREACRSDREEAGR